MKQVRGGGSAYIQVLEDIDENVLVWGKDIDAYLGFPDRELHAIDFRFTSAPRIDGRNSTVGSLIGWHSRAEKLDLGNSTSPYVAVKDANIDEFYAARGDFGRLDIGNSRMPSVTLSNAVIDELDVDGADIDALDLSGASIGRIDGSLDGIDVTVDEDTYIHDVPSDLKGDLGYTRVTEKEVDVITAMSRLGYGADYSVKLDDVRWYVQDVMQAAKTDPVVNGVVSSLYHKGFVEAEDGQLERRYALTGRGLRALPYIAP